MMKRLTLLIGILGVVIYVLGIRMIINPIPSYEEAIYMQCLNDWSPIDGHRFLVKDVAWTMDEKNIRFTVVKNAYWPCSQAETYIVNADGTEPRILMEQSAFEWDQPLTQNRNTSPSGAKSIRWSDGFWWSDEFYMEVLDQNKGQEFNISIESLLKDLEAQAREKCISEECRQVMLAGPSNFEMVFTSLGVTLPMALVLLLPAMWVRRYHTLAKAGIAFIILHLMVNVVIVLSMVS